MATYTEEIDEFITVDGEGILNVDAVTTTFKDSVEIGRSRPHSIAIPPGSDTSNQSAKVTAIANATWTDEVVAAYAAQIALNIANEGG
jgi:hypothetical protein